MSQVRILPGAPRIPLVPPLDEITTAAVRTWRGQFAVKGNDSAGAKAYGVLRAIRQSAEDDGLITRNLCRLKGAGHAMKRRESIALTPAALAALADAMPPQWRALTLVSGWCGLRIGEAAGLRHGDVDLEHGVLRIVQTAQYIGAQLVIGPPKSARGARTVHMPRHVTHALGEFIDGKSGWKPKDQILWTDVLVIVAASVVIASVFHTARESVLVVMIMHATNNAVGGNYASQLFDGADQTRLGILTAIAWWLGATAVLITMKRSSRKSASNGKLNR